MRMIHVDRAWNPEIGTTTQWYGIGFAEMLQAQFGIQCKFGGPLSLNDCSLVPGGCSILLLPWKGMNPKPFKNMRELAEQAQHVNHRLILLGDDLHMHGWAAPCFEGLEVCTIMVSNFRNGGRYWKHPSAAPPFWWGQYPFHHLVKMPHIEAKYEVGYFGRFFPKRLTILRELNYPVTLLGYQWFKQNDFQFVSPPSGTYWYYCAELIRLAKWHITVQDENQRGMNPAVSRWGEVWAADRPLMIHSSNLAGRPDIPWDQFEKYIVREKADVRKIVDNIDPAEAHADQVARLQPLYYGNDPLEKIGDFL